MNEVQIELKLSCLALSFEECTSQPSLQASNIHVDTYLVRDPSMLIRKFVAVQILSVELQSFKGLTMILNILNNVHDP
jgi:hypothetical protein